ncbi:MAG: PD-(D/E)XK nuclease family protein [Ignavibacteriales bacterium]|nr:PD-(D/E)XK nuclease family protein [Ignavibacteriales bacterium]
MAKSYLISPSVNLIDEVLKRLSAEGLDYSKNLVIFPGKRPGYFLRKAIATKKGTSFIPPRELSMEEFVELIHSDILGHHEPTLEALDVVAILFEEHLRSRDRFGGKHFDRLDEFVPLGIKLFDELEELKIAGCSPKLVHEKISGITYGKIHLLPDLFERFYREVSKRGYITRSMKYITASTEFTAESLTKYKTIIVAGFFALMHAEREIFRKLLTLNQTTFLLQHARLVSRIVAELGLEPEEVGEPAEEPSVTMYRSPDVHGQVFALTSQVQELIDRKAPLDENTVMVLPSSDALFPVLHQTLSLLKENQYNISLGYGLARSPVYAFFDSVLELIASKYQGAYHAPSYIKFALHPYTKNILFRKRADVTRVLFHTIEAEFAERGATTFFELENLEAQKNIFGKVQRTLSGSDQSIAAIDIQRHLKYIHDRTIRPLEEFRDVRDFSEKCVDVLNFIYDESTARLHPYFHPFAEKMIESMDKLSRGLLSSHAFEDQRSYVKLVREYLSTNEVHFAGTPLRGIQALGLLETRNLRFSRVFVLDVNEDVLPGRTNRTANLLPEKIREELGLETTYDREQLQEAYFDTLIRGAKEVRLFFTENGRREKSRFAEKLLWERQKRERQSEEKAFIKTISYQLSLKNAIPQPVEKTAEMREYLRGISYTATSLDSYLQCPLKFYYSQVAGLEEKEEVTEDIEARDIGNLIHDILLDWYRPTLDTTLTGKSLNEEELRRVIDDNMRKRFGEYEYGTLTLMKMQIEKQLLRFLRNYQIPLAGAAPITVKGLESKAEIDYKGFMFRVRMDRIERRNGDTHILDYKTGGDPFKLKTKIANLNVDDTSTLASSVGSFQLPLYAMVYKLSTNVPVEKIKPAFLFIGKSKIDATIESPLFDKDLPQEVQYEKLEHVLFKTLNEIVDVKTPFRATENLEEQCPRCPFKGICGTQWVLGWNQ